jgi:hypothetical protein
MFFISVSKRKSIDELQWAGAIKFSAGSWLFTVVTDNFLSSLFPDRDGFSIIESPLAVHRNAEKVVFLKATYSKGDNSLDIFRSTLSGRPVYYHLTREGEFFCSTHISMLRKAGVTLEENTRVLPEFFVYRYVMPPSTLYKDICTHIGVPE